MQGQKPIYTFLVFIIIVFMFNFYKNVIKRDKELKQQREDAIRQKIELQLRNSQEMYELEEKRAVNLKRRQELLNRMREYETKCYDIHALIEKPEKLLQTAYNSANHIDSIQNDREILADHYISNNKKAGQENSLDQERIKSTKNEVIEPMVYLFVFILILSLVKAISDISNHIKKKSAVVEVNENTRCSLQEYASIKHEKRIPKAPFARRSTLVDMNSSTKSLNKSFEDKRKSRNIPEFGTGSGLITEPGTPTKPTNVIAARPPPLLRRCSVPAFANQQLGTSGKLRRPSYDSFSEDDSSPDVKRRVRMIHRH